MSMVLVYGEWIFFDIVKYNYIVLGLLGNLLVFVLIIVW